MAEKRRPQDGRIKTDKGGDEVEVRVSIVPTAFGEKIVMRLLDKDNLMLDMTKLGYEAESLLKKVHCTADSDRSSGSLAHSRRLSSPAQSSHHGCSVPFGSQRDRWADADSLAAFCGIAPVTPNINSAPP